MSSLDVSAIEPPRQTYLGLTAVAWIQVGVIALLMGLLFRFNLVRLWHKTNPFYGEGNWGHSIFVPVIGLYYLYINSDELLKAKVQPLLVGGFSKGRLISTISLMVAGVLLYLLGPVIWLAQADNLQYLGMGFMGWGFLALGLNWGIGSMLLGILVFLFGIWPGQNDYVKDLGMVITLFGVVLTMCGWEVMKIAWFPIAFLVCALPWPGLVYSWVASPLQSLAAKVAVKALSVTGVTAINSGTKISYLDTANSWRTLNVAEACAGMRSLMTFISVGAAVAFLSARPLWQKFVITLSAIPIAIFCNVLRVSGQCLLDHYWSREVSEGFAHQFVGLLMLIPAFFLILLVCWILDQLFIEEADPDALAAAAAAKPAILERTPRGAAAPSVAGSAAAASTAAVRQAAGNQAGKAGPVVVEVPRHRLARGRAGGPGGSAGRKEQP